jgi:hypothetical protein
MISLVFVSVAVRERGVTRATTFCGSGFAPGNAPPPALSNLAVERHRRIRGSMSSANLIVVRSSRSALTIYRQLADRIVSGDRRPLTDKVATVARPDKAS